MSFQCRNNTRRSSGGQFRKSRGSIAPVRKDLPVIGRRGAITTGIAFGVASASVAFSTGSARAMTGAAGEGARAFVCKFTDQAMAVMADHTMDAEQRLPRFRDVFVASFDLPAIGEAALGRHWREASADQQVRFLQLFEQQQVLIFAGRFRYICRNTMTVHSADAGFDGVWRIPSQVDRANASPIPVDWSVATSLDGWRVIDLAIEGASMAFILRADFGAVLQTHGGRFDALLTAMQSKIDELSAA